MFIHRCLYYYSRILNLPEVYLLLEVFYFKVSGYQQCSAVFLVCHSTPWCYFIRAYHKTPGNVNISLHLVTSGSFNTDISLYSGLLSRGALGIKSFLERMISKIRLLSFLITRPASLMANSCPSLTGYHPFANGLSLF